jgi:nitroreductase
MLRIIKSRRTVRRFQRKPVPAGALKRILEAGNWAPFSAYAPQGRMLVALIGDEREMAAEIVKQCPAILKYYRIQYEASSYGHEQKWTDKARDFGSTMGNAPVIIVTVAKVMRARFPMMHNMAAAWTATQNMMIQAAAEGLASGVVTFTTPKVQAALLQHLGLTPSEWVVTNVLNVGYADEQPPAPPRSNDLIAIRGSAK